MRDIPVFTTKYGVASLILNQIPYGQKAYIRIQHTQDGENLLKECVEFCKAAGAQQCYCAQHPVCMNFPEYTKILRMQASRESIGETDVCIFPMTQQTVSQWRQIYNEKIVRIPGSRFLSAMEAEKFLEEGQCYFVHRDGKLLGTGKVSDDCIHWICAVEPGAGESVLQALCRVICTDIVHLEVSAENQKAVDLYQKMGFSAVGIGEIWYEIKF